jgi:hypothetical protein
MITPVEGDDPLWQMEEPTESEKPARAKENYYNNYYSPEDFSLDAQQEKGENYQVDQPVSHQVAPTPDSSTHRELIVNPQPVEDIQKIPFSLLESIEIKKITAHTTRSFPVDEEGEKFIVTITMTISFWNVGEMIDGHHEAKSVTVFSSSLTGESYSRSMEGRFTGGPNGRFSFQGENGTINFKLVKGQIIETGDPEIGRLKVSDPAGFYDWPDSQ